ncbi:14019_t:CDS:2 [Dentiscutata heterogama]|uniref:14019_t:CDS:1 n=1 Tax=Dentiscutata heterogama TaxID=1316150 RepID=A0ACA9K4A4_9GLOM|nr:14019_t:CDS:2 [Dentiscutata heterogama]
MSGATYFLDIAEQIEENVPWGVTANLLVRRYKDNIKFNPNFPKTGGFRGAHSIRAIHPR